MRRLEGVDTHQDPHSDSGIVGAELSICIVSYNTSALLRRCLKSIVEGTCGIRAEIIVVDNNSSDDSVAMVREEFPFVSVIPNADNRGYAAAGNQAISLASGEFVLMLNPDAYVFSNTLSTMLDLMRQDDRIGASGCYTVSEHGEPCPTARHRPSAFRGLIHAFGLTHLMPRDAIVRKYLGWLVGTRFAQFSEHKIRFEPHYLDGGFLLVRRRTIDEVGLMDENLFLNNEDFDWCCRMAHKRWKICFTPEATVCHEMHASKNAAKEASFVQWFKSYLYVLYKHRGPLSYEGVRAGILLGMGLHIVVAAVAVPFLGINRARKLISTYQKVFRVATSYSPSEMLARRRALVRPEHL